MTFHCTRLRMLLIEHIVTRHILVYIGYLKRNEKTSKQSKIVYIYIIYISFI